MENHVKGTGYDIRNNHRHCKSCRYHSDDHQHHRHYDQHLTIL